MDNNNLFINSHNNQTTMYKPSSSLQSTEGRQTRSQSTRSNLGTSTTSSAVLTLPPSFEEEMKEMTKSKKHSTLVNVEEFLQQNNELLPTKAGKM